MNNKTRIILRLTIYKIGSKKVAYEEKQIKEKSITRKNPSNIHINVFLLKKTMLLLL